jgi:hypothetical protein
MKKISFLLLIWLFMSQVSLGQFNWGIKGGLNVSTAHVGDSTNPYSIQFNIGFWGELNLGSRFCLLTELQYSQKGYLLTDSKIGLGSQYPNYRHYYLTIPVLAGYKVSNKLAILLGPELGFLLRVNFQGDDGTKINVTDSYRKFDIGIAAGLRYQPFARWGIEFRDVIGLIGVHPPEVKVPEYGTGQTIIGYGVETFPEDANPKNQVFQLGFFYSLYKQVPHGNTK